MQDNYRTYHLGLLADIQEKMRLFAKDSEQEESNWKRLDRLADDAAEDVMTQLKAADAAKEKFMGSHSKLCTFKQEFGELQEELFMHPEQFDEWLNR